MNVLDMLENNNRERLYNCMNVLDKVNEHHEKFYNCMIVLDCVKNKINGHQIMYFTEGYF